jgi:serine/threonine protein kinase
MLTTLEELIAALSEHGVVDPDALTRVLDDLPPEAQFPDAKSMARELHRRSLLTYFQAREVLKGKARGLVFGPYVVLDFLGGGGMGCVYKARHRGTGRIVALKTLSPLLADTPEMVQRFNREVEAFKRLVHPHIVAVLDAGQSPAGLFLVLEYVRGGDLYSWVRAHGPMLVHDSVVCLLQAASGLHFAHEQGVVHRDIKPSNLLLDHEGVVRVTDLGVARLVQLDESDEAPRGRLTRDRQLLGTPDYMSPEQARDPRHADARSDIYSLGCTWHFLLTGRPPYRGDTDILKLLAHREQPIPPLTLIPPYLSEQADGVFQKMLAKSPEYRFQSMAEVISALQAVMTAESPAAVPGGSVATPVGAYVTTGQTDVKTVDYVEKPALPDACASSDGSLKDNARTSPIMLILLLVVVLLALILLMLF